MKELTKAAEELFSFHPTPWRIEADHLDGWVVDASDRQIFGGEACEGYVDESCEEIVALIKTINALGEFLKEE